jgi:hypothetical protein
LQGQQTVKLVTRSSATLTFPVPLFRPTTANTPMALDIMPNGTGLNANNGYAWLDVCDVDVTGSFTGDVAANTASARLAAMTDHVSLESYYSGGTSKGLWLKTPQNTTTRVPIIKLNKAVSGARTADDQTLTAGAQAIFASGGSIVASSGYRLPAAAVNGFLYIPALADAPSGTPAAYGKSCPLAYDAATDKLWIYNYATAGLEVDSGGIGRSYDDVEHAVHR